MSVVVVVVVVVVNVIILYLEQTGRFLGVIDYVALYHNHVQHNVPKIQLNINVS